MGKLKLSPRIPIHQPGSLLNNQYSMENKGRRFFFETLKNGQGRKNLKISVGVYEPMVANGVII